MSLTTHDTGLPKSYSKRDFVATFKADPELWSRFKGECVLRGVSICHVLEALMEAWIEGQKATATVIKPVTINLTMQHIVKRPRRLQQLEDLVSECDKKTWPPSCKHADDFIRGSREVGCARVKDYVSLGRCWRCYIERGFGTNV